MTRTNVRGLGLWLILASLIGIVGLVISAAMMMMSPMMFDSGETHGRWVAFTLIWTMPFVLLLGMIVAWAGYAVDSRFAVLAGLVLWAIPLLLALFSLAYAVV